MKAMRLGLAKLQEEDKKTQKIITKGFSNCYEETNKLIKYKKLPLVLEIIQRALII